MKIKNYTLINYDNILSQYADKRFPQKISYAITKNIMLVGKELEAYRTSLKKIMDSYSEFFEKDEKGNPVNLPIGIPKVDEAHMDDYTNEINDLLQIEVDVNLFKISDDAFDYSDDKYDVLTPAEIITLSQIMCDN